MIDLAYNEIISLRKRPIPGIDAYGDLDFSPPEEREIFARPCSIGMKEFYQAAAVGLQPEIKFVIADAEDYEGELELVYHGVMYRILRTYQAGTTLELICYREPNRTEPAGPGESDDEEDPEEETAPEET